MNPTIDSELILSIESVRVVQTRASHDDNDGGGSGDSNDGGSGGGYGGGDSGGADGGGDSDGNDS